MHLVHSRGEQIIGVHMALRWDSFEVKRLSFSAAKSGVVSFRVNTTDVRSGELACASTVSPGLLRYRFELQILKVCTV